MNTEAIEQAQLMAGLARETALIEKRAVREERMEQRRISRENNLRKLDEAVRVKNVKRYLALQKEADDLAAQVAVQRAVHENKLVWDRFSASLSMVCADIRELVDTGDIASLQGAHLPICARCCLVTEATYVGSKLNIPTYIQGTIPPPVVECYAIDYWCKHCVGKLSQAEQTEWGLREVKHTDEMIEEYVNLNRLPAVTTSKVRAGEKIRIRCL